MTTTAEQPAAKAETPLSENTNIKLGFVVTIVVAAMSVGGLYYKVENLRERVEKSEMRDDEQDKRTSSLELGAVGNAAALANLSTLVAKMDAKLDRLLDNRSTNANYRPRPGTP